MFPFVSTRTERKPSRLREAAFTLSEALIALAVLGSMSSGAYLGFHAINAYSVSSRLYSEAQAVAQNQIDLILSARPFNVTSVPYRVPPVLCLDPTTAGTATCKETASTGNGPLTVTKQNVFVYTDPVTGKAVVSGTMATTIENLGTTMDYDKKTTPLNIRKATVTVSYRFRDKNYAVTMRTLRTADQ